VAPQPVPAAGATAKPAAKTAKATVTIVVPLKGRTTLARRRPGYVSPNTQSFGITTLTNEDLPYSGSPEYINIGSTSPNCTNNGSTLTCTGVINPPIGIDTFSVEAYSGPNGGGAALSQDNSVSATILPAIPVVGSILGYNVISMTLDAVATAVTVTTSTVNGVLSTLSAPGSAQTIPVTVTAKDCTGATIVGPGDYVNPISLTLAEFPSLGATSLSETSVTTPGDAVTLSWTGSGSTQYAAIAPSVPSSEDGCNNGSSDLVPGYFLPYPEPPYLWVASNQSGTASLVGYPTAWLQSGTGGGTTRPGVELQLSNDTLTSVAVDSSGAVYGSYAAGQTGTYAVKRFAPNATFTDAPSNVIPYAELAPAAASAEVEDIGVAPNGTLFDAYAATPASDDGINEIAAPYTSAVSYYTNTAAAEGDFNGPEALAVDGAGDVFLASQSFGSDPTISVVRQGSGTIQGYDAGAGNVIIGLAVEGQNLIAAIAAQGGGSSYYPEFVSYSIAGLTSGTANGTLLFSGTPSTLPDSGKQLCTTTNCLAIDAQGYYYLASTGSTFYVFSPSAGGTGVLPIGTVNAGFDPTTASNQMVVPSGEVAPLPTSSIDGLATQP
jgi:hypothetical protein